MYLSFQKSNCEIALSNCFNLCIDFHLQFSNLFRLRVDILIFFTHRFLKGVNLIDRLFFLLF